MDALFRGFLIVGAIASMGATYTTPNFVIEAPTPEFAKQVGEAAEIYRKELAIEWSGEPLPGDWSYRCPIHVMVGSMGAGGKTTFNFQSGKVYGWRMEIRGSEQRILDSVLPHEINHTIFASLFRRPLPRWADEGAASLIEHESERNQLRQIHSRAMNSHRKIPLRTLLEIKQYPQDQQDVLTMYAEGHSLADFLIQRGDKRRYMSLLETAHRNDWETAFRKLYGFSSVEKLEREWDQWVMAGSPKLNIPDGTMVADRDRAQANQTTTIRGQSPTTVATASAGSGINLGEATTLTDAARDGSQADAKAQLAVNTQGQNDPQQIAQASGTLTRKGLRQPLLTVNRQTTNAAKVPQE